MSAEKKPYIVHQDIRQPMQRLLEQRQHPGRSRHNALVDEVTAAQMNKLGQLFTETELVPEEEIRQGIQDALAQLKHHVVSLDRVFVEPQPKVVSFIEITRGVDRHMNDKAFTHRHSTGLRHQIARLAALLHRKHVHEIALVDDVSCGGTTLAFVIEQLQHCGIQTREIVVGTALRHGFTYLQQRFPHLNLQAIRLFEDATDIISQRDLMVGFPYGGRMVIDGVTKKRSPYPQPTGNVEKWASIQPADALDFSQFCLLWSLTYWKKIDEGYLPTKVTHLHNELFTPASSEMVTGDSWTVQEYILALLQSLAKVY